MSGSTPDVARDETTQLISSDKVAGTSVYDTEGSHIGAIESVMIGKADGRVAYAVLSFGGFLGIGTEHYPVPWPALKYDTRIGGYVTGITREQLQGAPHGSSWATADVDRHYGQPGIMIF
jgi:sporulation protein YlmC with PRC-barrel domain